MKHTTTNTRINKRSHCTMFTTIIGYTIRTLVILSLVSLKVSAQEFLEPNLVRDKIANVKEGHYDVYGSTVLVAIPEAGVYRPNISSNEMEYIGLRGYIVDDIFAISESEYIAFTRRDCEMHFMYRSGMHDIYRTTDGGVSWHIVDSFGEYLWSTHKAPNGDIIFTTVEYGSYLLRRGANTLQEIAGDTLRFTEIVRNKNDVLFAVYWDTSSYAGEWSTTMYTSNDTGRHWTQIALPLQLDRNFHLYLDKDGEVILIGECTNGLPYGFGDPAIIRLKDEGTSYDLLHYDTTYMGAYPLSSGSQFVRLEYIPADSTYYAIHHLAVYKVSLDPYSISTSPEPGNPFIIDGTGRRHQISLGNGIVYFTWERFDSTRTYHFNSYNRDLAPEVYHDKKNPGSLIYYASNYSRNEYHDYVLKPVGYSPDYGYNLTYVFDSLSGLLPNSFVFDDAGNYFVVSRNRVMRFTMNTSTWDTLPAYSEHVQIPPTRLAYSGINHTMYSWNMEQTDAMALQYFDFSLSSWNSTSLPSGLCRYITSRNDGTLFALVGGRIYQCSVPGYNWTESYRAAGTDSVLSLRADASGNQYIITTSTILTLPAFGSNWTEYPNLPPFSHSFYFDYDKLDANVCIFDVNDKGDIMAYDFASSAFLVYSNAKNNWWYQPFDMRCLQPRNLILANDNTVILSTVLGLFSNAPRVVNTEELAVPPSSFLLHQNYPNPFNPGTQIEYELPATTAVTIRVTDALGRTVLTADEGIQSAGMHSWHADLTGRPSGLYFYTVRAGDAVQTKKMMLVK